MQIKSYQCFCNISKVNVHATQTHNGGMVIFGKCTEFTWCVCVCVCKCVRVKQRLWMWVSRLEQREQEPSAQTKAFFPPKKMLLGLFLTLLKSWINELFVCRHVALKPGVNLCRRMNVSEHIRECLHVEPFRFFIFLSFKKKLFIGRQHNS